MRVPVVTYHSMRVDGNDYSTNDHIAFREDLRTSTALGYEVVALDRVVRVLLREAGPDPGRRLIAFTFDDGSDFDFHDLPHPAWGVQRSMLNIMHDFRAAQGSACVSAPHATSFVVVSPEARCALDRSCMIGRNWWRDDWWRFAIATGMLAIGNHSWDHNHPGLDGAPASIRVRGTFNVIDDFTLAEDELARASSMLNAMAPNPAADLFAYPYGEAPDYVALEYLPLHGPRIGIRAAFTCDPRPVESGSNRWMIPRYVFGRDWSTPEGFAALLRDASGGSRA